MRNRRLVIGRNPKQLAKRVKDLERRGWHRVGKGVEIYQIDNDAEFMQVMEFGKLVNSN